MYKTANTTLPEKIRSKSVAALLAGLVVLTALPLTASASTLPPKGNDFQLRLDEASMAAIRAHVDREVQAAIAEQGLWRSPQGICGGDAVQNFEPPGFQRLGLPLLQYRDNGIFFRTVAKCRAVVCAAKGLDARLRLRNLQSPFGITSQVKEIGFALPFFRPTSTMIQSHIKSAHWVASPFLLKDNAK